MKSLEEFSLIVSGLVPIGACIFRVREKERERERVKLSADQSFFNLKHHYRLAPLKLRVLKYSLSQTKEIAVDESIAPDKESFQADQCFRIINHSYRNSLSAFIFAV